MVQVSKGCLNEVIITSLLEVIKGPFKDIIPFSGDELFYQLSEVI